MKVPISQIQVFHEQVLVLMPIRFTNRSCMPLISRAADILEVLYSEYHQSGLKKESKYCKISTIREYISFFKPTGLNTNFFHHLLAAQRKF